MGINVKHLLDRPCSVCEFHKENGCCKWSCVFEGEPIIDKIRAEILEEHENAYAREDNDTAYGLSVALDILDKYKAESEDTGDK
jgi:hypothetical protein